MTLHGKQQNTMSCLATDLDGTLIPMSESPQHHRDLKLLEHLLSDYEMSLVFVTGRHIVSVHNAIADYQLPRPRWILSDVGTSAFERHDDGLFHAVPTYADLLQTIVGTTTPKDLLNIVASIPNLQPQESEKQAPFKTSFYAPATRLAVTVAEIEKRLDQSDMPWQVINSIDPITGVGLIDLLPSGVSKAFALDWWCREQNVSPETIIFAGDSGNDLAAFNAGYRTIIVGNAPAAVVDKVRDTHRSAGWTDRLFHAFEHATSGVLEGVRHYVRASPGMLT